AEDVTASSEVAVSPAFDNESPLSERSAVDEDGQLVGPRIVLTRREVGKPMTPRELQSFVRLHLFVANLEHLLRTSARLGQKIYGVLSAHRSGLPGHPL